METTHGIIGVVTLLGGLVWRGLEKRVTDLEKDAKARDKQRDADIEARQQLALAVNTLSEQVKALREQLERRP